MFLLVCANRLHQVGVFFFRGCGLVLVRVEPRLVLDVDNLNSSSSLEVACVASKKKSSG